MSGQSRQPQRNAHAAHPEPQRPRPQPRPFDLEAYPGLSKHMALAVHLLDEIEAGAYPVGERLPSIRQMAEAVGLTARTVQLTYETLAKEQYLINRERQGFFVAAAPERDDTPTRAEDGQAAATTPDHDQSQAAIHQPSQARPRPTQTLYVQGNLPTQASRIVHLDVRTVPPTAAVALALRQPDPAAPVILRRRTIADPSGAPVEIRTSYLPAAIAAGTALAEAEVLPGPWESLVWEHTGYAPASAETTITSRRINPREAITFGIPGDSATALVRDVTLYSSRDASGPALSLTQYVWPGESTRLTHRHLVQP